MADFIQVMTVEEVVSLSYSEWKIYIDGASRAQRFGVGVILIGPSKISIKYAVKIKYNATNNVAEYEVLITGLRLAIEVRYEHLKV